MRGLQCRRDMALRSVLGASPARLFRLVWLESLTVSLVGALCAVAVCLLAQDLLRSVTPPVLRGFVVSPVAIRGLLFALAAVAGTSLVAALMSAPRGSGESFHRFTGDVDANSKSGELVGGRHLTRDTAFEQATYAVRGCRQHFPRVPGLRAEPAAG